MVAAVILRRQQPHLNSWRVVPWNEDRQTVSFGSDDIPAKHAESFDLGPSIGRVDMTEVSDCELTVKVFLET